MRDLVVMAMVGVISMVGLAEPFIGFLGYIWFGLMRPDAMAYSGPNRYSLVLAVATLVGSIRNIGYLNRILEDPLTKAFLLLHVPIGLSVVFAPNSSLSLEKYIPFIQLSLMLLLFPLLVAGEKELRWAYLVIAFSIGFVGFKFGAYGLLGGGIRYSSGLQGFHSDNNTLALGMAMAVPLCYHAMGLCKPFWAKAMFATLAFGSIATIFQTHSRGGIIALAAALLLEVWHSPHRIRALVVLVLLSLPAPLLMWDSLTERMGTLESPLEEGSAASRLQLNLAAVRLIQDHFFFGVGFGADNYIHVAAKYLPSGVNYHVVHNNYLQMFADSGVGAFVIFVFMLLFSIFWLGRQCKQLSKDGGPFFEIGRGLQLSLVAFAFGSTFLSRTNYDFIYILLLTTGCLYRLRSATQSQMVEAVGGVMVAAPAAALPAAPAPLPTPQPTPTQAVPRPVGLGRALRRAGEVRDGRR